MKLSRNERRMLHHPPGPIVREGLYKFQNNARGELHLARPTASGVKKVGIGQQFQGDSYYLQMVKTGELKLVEVIQVPGDASEILNESKMETTMEADKLILEQPPTVTDAGRVEYVVPKKNQKKLNEDRPSNPASDPDMLLNENPLDGIELM